MMNIINGGCHANNRLDFQEFMILPIGFDLISSSIKAGAEIFHSLRKSLDKLNMSTAVGDEGGFAPDLDGNRESLELILESIDAGIITFEDVDQLLLETSPKDVKKKQVKKLIKSKS